MNKPHLFAEVILEQAIDTAFDYIIPEEFQTIVKKGSYVRVPLRTRSALGFVTNIKPISPFLSVKPIQEVLTQEAIITEELFTLGLWIAKYYACPLGKVLKTMTPKGVRNSTEQKQQFIVSRAKTKQVLMEACVSLRKSAPKQAAILDVMLQVKKNIFLTELLEEASTTHITIKALEEKGLLLLKKVHSHRDVLEDAEYFQTKPKKLHLEQEESLNKITKSIEEKTFQPHLLFGVTGSGKTEVYLQAIQRALDLSLGVIVLVPEIALTQQTIQRMRCRFSVPIAVLHHRLSDSERYAAWKKILDGSIPIVLGARSSIFSPVQNLGLIIVDEEHDASYKQTDEAPRYHARDVAVMRARLSNATVILGSATPSIESFHNVQKGKYHLSTLTQRGGSVLLPKVHIVDMRKEFEKSKGVTSFSDLLLHKIKEKHAQGEQSILFLNRRGYHTLLCCTSCGKSISCSHCDRSLTFHMTSNILSCHLCDFQKTPPRQCPECHSHNMLQFRGVGTEKIEAMLQAIFPYIRIGRIDADTTKHKGSLEKLLQEFRSGKTELLIGTQMIAKGLHFPDVTLVGVLNCDMSLQIPDFRAQENVFQLITQVSGRSGRGDHPGEVILQTTLPTNSTILHAAEQNYTAFFQEEIQLRQLFGFPPFSKIVKCTFIGSDEKATEETAQKELADITQFLPRTYTCHPVVPSAHKKVKDAFRFQFLIRGPSVQEILNAIEKKDQSFKRSIKVRRSIDVDPTSTFF